MTFFRARSKYLQFAALNNRSGGSSDSGSSSDSDGDEKYSDDGSADTSAMEGGSE